MRLCMQIRKAIGWEPERLQAPQPAADAAADQLLLPLLAARPPGCFQLEAPVMPPAGLHSSGDVAAELLQQCLDAVDVPDVSGIPVPQLASSFDCFAEAAPLRAPAAAGSAAAEEPSLTALVCSDRAPIQQLRDAAQAAMLDVPHFAPLAVATAESHARAIRAAIAAADTEVAQLLGNVDRQVS